MASPAVFLDRDGVLNAAVVTAGVPHPPNTEADLRLLPGVVEACRVLSMTGFKLVCVTNQPDIARGTQSPAIVARINARLEEHLGLDEVLVCPHDDADACTCRKPLAGMFFDAADRLDLDLVRSVTVGDRWRDIEAGRAAGTLTVFIDRGYRERASVEADLTVAELGEAVPWIIDRLPS